MLQRRWLRLLAVIIGLTLVAAACGSDDNSTTTSSTDTTDTTGDTGSEPDPAAADAVTLDDLCTEAKDAGVTAPDGFVVRLVTDIGKVDDRTFNQSAFEAMEAAKDCFGFETSFIETASQADYAANIATVVDGGPDLVITSGALLGDDTLTAAQDNPEINFLGIDQFQVEYPANYAGALFREDQAGFLAGVAAAQLTKTKVIGVVGGREDVPPVVRLVNAYEAGAKSIDPDIEVFKVYNESFTDTTKGASDAQQFIGDGADVIFGAGGLTGSAGIVEGATNGTYAIGVDKDEYFATFDSGAAPGADRLATSAMKRVDIAVFQGIIDLLNDDFGGASSNFTAADGGIAFAPPHDADVPEDFTATLQKTLDGLADESIDTGVDPITGLPK